MKALRVERHGPPTEVLHLDRNVGEPEPIGNEVAIAVEACALNFADDLLCRGTYQQTPPTPFTPGLEVAGTIVAAGPEAEHQVGERVVGSPSLPYGGLADTCLARSDDVFRLHQSLPAVDAAAMHVTYQTGWFALYRRAVLRPDETLLVHAGAGGVGSAAIQLGKAAGAFVIASAGGPDKVRLCRELGADLALDHLAEDIVDAVKDASGGRGADVVFDPVGGETFVASTRCIAWEGRLLVIGAASGHYVDARTNHVLVKNYSVIGLNWGGYRTRRPDLVRSAHDDLVRLHREGKIAPLVSRVVSIAEAPAALADLTARATTGKVVVTPRAASPG